jgi:hypothetical protein
MPILIPVFSAPQVGAATVQSMRFVPEQKDFLPPNLLITALHPEPRSWKSGSIHDPHLKARARAKAAGE